ncbi:MAG: hypothetical protein KF736_12410 [Acidobacteria bacterium]|nr:hypothetical protein [Acidobacteriota bacterium]MCW5950489.1 hypothetical protein [Pyrinomonadaceae bacterium]
MKRIEQKVKDLVEVRPYSSLKDFVADPSKTVSGYHFTDDTAELMVKWLNKIGRITEEQGASFALAGFRGVGKSHFLAALGATLENPDLRARIGDAYVEAAANALMRRRFPVVWVKRGTGATILDEFRAGAANTIGCDVSELPTSVESIVARLAGLSEDARAVVLVDTAAERDERVARDDGPMLGELAEAAKRSGIFVGIALDDDISGADGPNSAIAKTFTIDYLDQEHLYKIVDKHIYLKTERSLPVLREIYETYRDLVPGFRWGEQRFVSLFPLHPAIMEVSPFVRLYLHEFALLGFASEAGARILGRPANSLIGPDEVFDNVEPGLRAIESLKEAFEAYDRLNRDVVAKTEVIRRLQAKLILKGLFLFSLNDEGATAAELAASMLIFDPADTAGSLSFVEDTLAAFASYSSDAISVRRDPGDVNRYALRIGANDGLNEALRVASASMENDTVELQLSRLIGDRFTDAKFGQEGQPADVPSVESRVIWRGGARRGRVVLDWSGKFNGDFTGLFATEKLNWLTVINAMPMDALETDTGKPIVHWRPAEFRPEEIETIKRNWLLHNDASIRGEFPESLASALQSNQAACGRILQRVLLEDGTLIVGGLEYNFVETARSATSLSEVLGTMLDPLFEARYPMHPFFDGVLSMKEVSSLVNDLFGGTRGQQEEVQAAAKRYAEPLGLVRREGEKCVPVPASVLSTMPTVALVLELVGGQRDSVIAMNKIETRLSEQPYGLTPEGVYLIVSAMVAERMVEFITSEGDRINHRSLDLKVIWDDIVGIALPEGDTYTQQRLESWAKTITGLSRRISLGDSTDRSEVREQLLDWRLSWERGKLAERFESIDDNYLTVQVWRSAAAALKAFGSVASNIEIVETDETRLDDVVARIADVFSDSEDEFIRHSGYLQMVEEFLSNAGLRSEISDYLSMCEMTGDDEIDALHAVLISRLEDRSGLIGSDDKRDLANLWSRFHRRYTEHFADAHDLGANVSEAREKLEQIMKTDVWWEYLNVRDYPLFDEDRAERIQTGVEKLKGFECGLDPRVMTKRIPACACGFSLAEAAEIDDQPKMLWNELNLGLSDLRKRLSEAPGLIESLRTEEWKPYAAEVSQLVKLIKEPSEKRRFTDFELNAIRSLPIASRSSGSEAKRSKGTAIDLDASEIEELIDHLG